MTSSSTATITRLTPEPLPENIGSVQPGGGVCFRIEMAWGGWRRGWLKLFRKGYVEKRLAVRKGEAGRCVQEVLDPRDLKFVRNQCTFDWPKEHDCFGWRESIPFARWGLAELQLMGWPLLALTILAGWWWWPVALVPGVVLGLIIYFFRDPPRRIPDEPNILISPADGTIAEITELDHDDFIGGPALRIGIFLSIFNVHINRAPCRCRVIRMSYHPGKFLNAMNPQSAILNENLWIGLEEEETPHRRLVVRQISGLIARRIVCAARSGEVLERGAKFGMIKLGSRTELIVPREPGMEITIGMGQKVKAGSTIFLRRATNAS